MMLAITRTIIYAVAFGVLFVAGAMLVTAAAYLGHPEAALLGLVAGATGPWVGAWVAITSQDEK